MKDTLIQNIQIDVIENSKDSLNHQKGLYPELIHVDNITSKYDYIIDGITMIGVLVTIVFTITSIRRLFKRDDQKQEQIDELINQTKELARHNALYEKRIRMIHKPRIWSNGGSTAAYDSEWSIRIDNKGEDATITSLDIIGGDAENAKFLIHGLPFELDKGKSCVFSGTCTEKNPNEIYLKIQVNYTDVEGYEYATIFDWKGGSTTLVETKEL
jgi:hypothetical protein